MSHSKPKHWYGLFTCAGGDVKEVSRHKLFDAAVSELTKLPGEWAADWSQSTLKKGRHYVTGFIEYPAED